MAKPVCIIKELPDALEFDCAENCATCDFKDLDGCGDYKWSGEEKIEAVLKWAKSKIGKEKIVALLGNV